MNTTHSAAVTPVPRLPGTVGPIRVARTHVASLIALWTPVAVALAMTGIYLWGNVTWMNETDFVEDDPLVGLGAVFIVVIGAFIVALTTALAVVGTCFTKVVVRSGVAIVGALVLLMVGAYVLYVIVGPTIDTADVTSQYGAAASSIAFIAGTALSVVPLIVAIVMRRRIA